MIGRSKDCSGRPVFKLSIHDSIHLIHRKDWDALAREAGPCLRYDHLRALEDAMSGSIQFRYAIFYSDRYRQVGIACFQILDLEDNGSEYGDRIRKFGIAIGSRIISELKVRSLVCGNVFHCGAHGAHFIQDISPKDRTMALEMAMEQLRVDERLEPRISVSIFKDIGSQGPISAQVLEAKSYHPLAMDVHMVMDVVQEWKDLEGYSASLTAKARTRIRSILKRAAHLEIKDLSVEEIVRAIPSMQRLFDQVLLRSPFIFGRLDMAVLAEWKKVHGDSYHLRGLYLKGALVGFSSSFVAGDVLEAQLVGIDYAVNEKHMIYQRILLDLLETALRAGKHRINFGRTAEQAKSSLGALPEQLPFYVKHRNRMANRLVGPFLRKVEPTAYEQRSPFKRS